MRKKVTVDLEYGNIIKEDVYEDCLLRCEDGIVIIYDTNGYTKAIYNINHIVKAVETEL